VPLVEIDGVPFTQSLAIIQHIARVHDLYGSNHLEAARIDAICDAVRLPVSLSLSLSRVVHRS